MSKLKWDETGKRIYETGVDRGVLYPVDATGGYTKGVSWSGLSSVSENPSGAEASPFYADNMKYLNIMGTEEFGATIEAFYYPDEFAVCDGSAELTLGVSAGQQNRKPFGFCYRTGLGNDIEGLEFGYKLHLVYGALASPSEKSHSSVNETVEPETMSWELTTTPVSVAGLKPTACLTIDSTKVDAAKLAAFEDILYGKDAVGEGTATIARLPLPDEVKSLMAVI